MGFVPRSGIAMPKLKDTFKSLGIECPISFHNSYEPRVWPVSLDPWQPEQTPQVVWPRSIIFPFSLLIEIWLVQVTILPLGINLD